MWSDIDCKSGLNWSSTKLIPLWTYSQPIIHGLLLNSLLKDHSSSIIDNNILLGANLIYSSIILYEYNKKSSTCTITNEDGHLTWAFDSPILNVLYHIMIILNSINHAHNRMLQIHIGWVYSMLLLSHMYNKKNTPELWCFSGTSTPLIVYLSQKFFF